MTDEASNDRGRTAAAKRAAAVQAEIERGRSGFYRRLLDDAMAAVLRR